MQLGGGNFNHQKSYFEKRYFKKLLFKSQQVEREIIPDQISKKLSQQNSGPKIPKYDPVKPVSKIFM